MDDKQILLVDDDKNRLNQLAEIIRTLGFKQVLLTDGADNAWVVMKNKKIDCIICAYEMKEMSGPALLKIIRRDDASSDIPFFLADKAFTKIKVLKAGQIGVTGLFVIPYDGKVMSRKIISALEKPKEPVVRKTQEIFDQGLQLIEKKEYGEA
jgi:CheY-like chemotaxis protein